MFGGEASDKKVRVLSGGERSRLAMIRLLLEPVNLLILDEPTNHLDMPSKDVLKDAIRAFDGTAILVSHDREFLDGLVTKVYEFGGGRVREHIGGIYDFLQSRNVGELHELGATSTTVTPAPQSTQVAPSAQKVSYEERRERQRQLRRIEKSVAESEDKIERMEQRLKELDTILCTPEGASDVTLITEYTSTRQILDQEVQRWEQLSEQAEEMKQIINT